MFSVTFTNDLKNNLIMIEMQIKSNVDLTKPLTNETEAEVKRKLCEFVRFNSDAEQLSETYLFFSSFHA